MKAAVASDHGKPIFDAGEEWRGATLFAYFTRARLQDVANAPLITTGELLGENRATPSRIRANRDHPAAVFASHKSAPGLRSQAIRLGLFPLL
jgi:hypothetical protein